MLQATLKQYPAPGRSWRHALVNTKRLIAAGTALVIMTAIASWFALSTHVTDLRNAQQIRDSGLYAAWAKGSVMVLIRHAERCDRSSNTCLGDPTGITVAGSQAAADVGNGIERLGLRGVDVISSPEVRTQQTAQFIFDKPVATQAWLNECDPAFAQTAFSHKRPDHNLVLVTHSGCIDHLQRQLGVPGGERSSEYASALLVSMEPSGKARILGQMSADRWQQLATQAGH